MQRVPPQAHHWKVEVGHSATTFTRLCLREPPVISVALIYPVVYAGVGLGMHSAEPVARFHPTLAEHEEMLEWCGGSFDPYACDINLINRKLKRIKL